MKKWVIKKEDSGRLEVWEYIESLEEAKSYPYIAEAVRKYGKENVLPVAVNSRGGYHSLKADIEAGNIVRIVESETPPELDLAEKWSINEGGFKWGWLSPDCEPYGCNYTEHLELARDICKQQYHVRNCRPDDYLFDKGWAKVYKSNQKIVWGGNLRLMNDKQVRFLEEKGIRWDGDEELSAEALIKSVCG